MKENLITKVSPQTLDRLMDALVSMTNEMKEVESNQQARLDDEVYTTCLCLQGVLLDTLRKRELKKQEGKEIAG